VVFLDRGRIVHAGPLDDWRRLWETPRLRLHFGTAPSAIGAADRLATVFGDAVSVLGPVTVDVLTHAPAGSVLEALDGDLRDLIDAGQVRLSLAEAMTMAQERTSAERERMSGRPDAATTA